MELDVGYVSTRRKTDSVNLNILTHSLNLNLYANDIKEIASPYLTYGVQGDTSGIGANNIEKKVLVGPDLGLGIRFNIMKKLAMRLEVRDVYLFRQRNDVLPALKITYLW